MFKYVATVSAVVAATTVQAAGEKSFHLKTYVSEDCSGNAFIDADLHYGECKKVDDKITVSELNDAEFSILKYSPDAPHEFYMFPNEEACKEYGNSFNPDIEAAFIRSPGTGCKPCKSCGKVKSVLITDPEHKEEEKTEVKKEDSSASSIAFSSAAVALSATVAMLF